MGKRELTAHGKEQNGTEEASPVVQSRPCFFPLNLVETFLKELIQKCAFLNKGER